MGCTIFVVLLESLHEEEEEEFSFILKYGFKVGELHVQLLLRVGCDGVQGLVCY